MIAFTNKTITCKIFRENNHKCNSVINQLISRKEVCLAVNSPFSTLDKYVGNRNYENLLSLFWQKFRESNVVSKDTSII